MLLVLFLFFVIRRNHRDLMVKIESNNNHNFYVDRYRMLAFMWLIVFFIPRIHSYANAVGMLHDFQLIIATSTPQFMGLVQSVYAMVPKTNDIAPAISKDVAIALDALRQAAVPMSVNTAISLTISDFVAGVVGGAVSRGTGTHRSSHTCTYYLNPLLTPIPYESQSLQRICWVIRKKTHCRRK